MENQIKLSAEQEFSIRAFNQQVDRMSPEQAKGMLKILHQRMIVGEALLKGILKHYMLGDIKKHENPD